MLYVERVRKYAGQSDITLDAFVNRAVDECIKENILADFLRKNRAEAIHMSIFEYDEERELALLRKDEYNAGVKETTESIVLRMLSAGTYKLDEIAYISGMDIEEVKKIGNLYTI